MPSTAPLGPEREAWERGRERVAGLDEAGRGPLAGPVVAAAVILRHDQQLDGVTDSKRLPAGRRKELAGHIRREVRGWALGAASTREVERLDPRGASELAMRRALDRLELVPDFLLVDGRGMPGLGEQRALAGGDRRSHSIACASVLAKVVRDRLMRRLHPRYPPYGWATNVGYGTAEHLAALRRHGPTPHHRRTFGPVAQAALELEG